MHIKGYIHFIRNEVNIREMASIKELHEKECFERNYEAIRKFS